MCFLVQNVKKFLAKELSNFILGNSTNGKSVEPHERMLNLLYFSGSNSFLKYQKWSNKLGTGTASESIRISLAIFYDNLVPKYLTLPTFEQAKKEAKLFAKSPRHVQSEFDWPKNCYLAMDGTHIAGK